MNGFTEEYIYYICEEKDNQIHSAICPTNQIVFTIEEFLEKFPYKVGDKVQHKGATSCGSVFEVEKMRWVGNHVEYTVKRLWYHNGYSVVTAKDLQPFEEETMDKAVFDANAQCCDIMNHLIKKETMEEKLTVQDIRDNNAEWLLNKLQEMSAEGALQTISDLYDELHKPQYPKTYDECRKMFGIPKDMKIEWQHPIFGYKIRLLVDLQKLLTCRDAYWRIAGEQMKLGKPWEPDWSNDLSKYYISFYNNKVDKGVISYSNKILAFPTEEMRNVFYENFKELIEQCKELL